MNHHHHYYFYRHPLPLQIYHAPPIDKMYKTNTINLGGVDVVGGVNATVKIVVIYFGQ
jgi:hypothetical protein